MQAFKYKISWRLKHMKHSSETLQLDEKGFRSNPYIFLGVLNKNLQLYEYESVYCGNEN